MYTAVPYRGTKFSTWSTPAAPRYLVPGTVHNGARLHCTIVQSKVFISRSCTILVLMLVLVHPRGTDAKNDIEYYQGQTTLLIKVHHTKTVIEKNSTVLHRESDSLSNLDRRVFRPPDFFFGCTFTSKLLIDNVIISRNASLEPTFKDHSLLYILTSYL